MGGNDVLPQIFFFDYFAVHSSVSIINDADDDDDNHDIEGYVDNNNDDDDDDDDDVFITFSLVLTLNL